MMDILGAVRLEGKGKGWRDKFAREWARIMAFAKSDMPDGHEWKDHPEGGLLFLEVKESKWLREFRLSVIANVRFDELAECCNASYLKWVFQPNEINSMTLKYVREGINNIFMKDITLERLRQKVRIANLVLTIKEKSKSTRDKP